MKKIAFIIRMFQEKAFHGGGEKLFYNLIKRFSEDGYSVDIYCSESDKSDKPYVDKVIEAKTLYDHNSPQSMEDFYDEVKGLISAENYDLVISENITPSVGITFLQGHSLVNRLRKNKNFLEGFLYRFRKVKRERIKYQKKWMEQGYQRIFVVSEILKNDIIENFKIPENQITVVYPGVEVTDSPEFKANSPVTFGLLAPGFSIKGGFVFLKALKILKQGGYDFRAKIVYPKYNKNLGVKTLVNLYGVSDFVEFLPYQDDIKSFYNSIDCLVVPSWEDTFNMAALEAMSCAKPCIISKNAGAAEIIEHKVNGLTHEQGHENLAKCMVYFINNSDKHEQLANSAFETAQKFTWDRAYAEFKEALKSSNLL